jgi:flagellar M-ring protein FliF
MDFNQSEQTEEKYDPQATAIRSRRSSSEQNEPTTTASAGVPGTASNGANPAPVFTPTGKTANSFMKDDETTNFEVSRLTRHTVESVGDIQKLSVAVIVDDAVKVTTAQDGTTSRTSTPRTPEELQKIRDLAAAAIGIDAMRGDTLTVENISFEVPADAPLGDTEGTPTFVDRWRSVIQPALKYGAFLLLFVMAYFLLFRPFSKRLLTPIDDLQVEGGPARRELAGAPGGNLTLATPKTIRELEAEVNGAGTMAVASPSDVRKADILRQRIAELVQRDPQNSAQLLRAWLSQEGKS